MSNETVVILGTGATQGSGFTKCNKPLPGDRGFFEHELVKNNLYKYPALDIMLRLFISTSKNENDKISLEDVWTFLEFSSKKQYLNLYNLEDEKKSWLERIGTNIIRTDEHCDVKKFRELKMIPQNLDKIDMSLLAGWELRLLVSEVYDHFSLAGKNVFEMFIEKYKINKDNETVFINFNYDTTLETALNDKTKWYYPHVESKIDRDPNGIRIIKPHGSLNWLLKGNVPSVSIITDYMLNPVRNVSTEVNVFEEAAIIAPTQMKAELNIPETQAEPITKLFSNLWEDMASALVKAERVFIIGYSFPSTDHHIRTLFRLVNKRKKLEEIKYTDVYCCTKVDGREGFIFSDVVIFFPCMNGYKLNANGFESFSSE